MAQGVFINATVGGGGGGNPFNQDLNTTDSPTFDDLSLTGTIVAGTGGNFVYGVRDTPGDPSSDGTYTLSVGPIAAARTGLGSGVPAVFLNQDDETGHSAVYSISYVDNVSKYGYAEFVVGLVNSAHDNIVYPMYEIGVDGNISDAGVKTNQRFYVYDAIAGQYDFTIVPGGITSIRGVLTAGGYKSSDGSAGVTAGPFTTITAITVKNGLITAITGS